MSPARLSIEKYAYIKWPILWLALLTFPAQQHHWKVYPHIKVLPNMMQGFGPTYCMTMHRLLHYASWPTLQH